MQNKPTVFLVEDNRMLRCLLADFLIEELGVECHAFETSDDALIALLELKSGIDLLVVDQLTPGQLSGTELAAMVQERWAGTPCILMSGIGGSALEMPANTTYMQKPIAVTQLIEAAVAAIPRRNG